MSARPIVIARFQEEKVATKSPYPSDELPWTWWRHFEIDASHSSHVTVPTSLATLLDKIAAIHVK